MSLHGALARCSGQELESGQQILLVAQYATRKDDDRQVKPCLEAHWDIFETCVGANTSMVLCSLCADTLRPVSCTDAVGCLWLGRLGWGQWLCPAHVPPVCRCGSAGSSSCKAVLLLCRVRRYGSVLPKTGHPSGLKYLVSPAQCQHTLAGSLSIVLGVMKRTPMAAFCTDQHISVACVEHDYCCTFAGIAGITGLCPRGYACNQAVQVLAQVQRMCGCCMPLECAHTNTPLVESV
jgi:hypothetical protein